MRNIELVITKLCSGVGLVCVMGIAMECVVELPE